jgi:hypothetical protein
MNRQEAEHLEARIIGERDNGEIAEDVFTSLDMDELARRAELSDIWSVIVDWPGYLKAVIRDEAQWHTRKSWFASE